MNGRGWAYVGALMGGGVSVAANVAHSYVPPAGARADWEPYTGAVIGSVVWPLALVVALEIFARTPWPDGHRWLALRFLGLLPVGAVAAIVSYRHMAGLLTFYGEDPVTRVIGPAAIDGLMVVATGALVATGVRRKRQATKRQSDMSQGDSATTVAGDKRQATRATATVTSDSDMRQRRALARQRQRQAARQRQATATGDTATGRQGEE